MDLNLHPELKGPLKALCSDPSTTIAVLSGSSRSGFGQKLWRVWYVVGRRKWNVPKGDWMTTMPEHLNMEWVDSVKHVFKYFTERTPRSHFETRDTSLIWNYKYADIEFGRLQARDLLQHLWTGPISNASADVVHGSSSVEVRARHQGLQLSNLTTAEPRLFLCQTLLQATRHRSIKVIDTIWLRKVIQEFLPSERISHLKPLAENDGV